VTKLLNFLPCFCKLIFKFSEDDSEDNENRSCSTHGRDKGCIQYFVKSEGKRPLRTYKRWWEDNIRTYHREVGWKDAEWIHLAQDGNQ